MPDINKPAGVVRFGPFELSAATGELRKNGIRLKLRGQPIQVLILLVAHPGKLVTREEFQQHLWPGNSYGDFEKGLNAAVNRLRDNLNDSATDPKYIETVPGRGYRFIEKLEGSNGEVGPGKTVSHYRILEVTGRGAMGIVYQGQDVRLGRRVALKFLRKELATNSQALERFRREASAASSLNHPNICTIYEIEEHDGQPFIVMELLRGQTLREFLDSGALLCNRPEPALDIDRLLDIALQTLEGLQAAHESGVLHRDIKPSNIFVTSNLLVKILDFGLAKLTAIGDQNDVETEGSTVIRNSDRLAARLSKIGAVIGTAGYMAPEQVVGADLDARSDLFSFGCVVYEMATGRPAFNGTTTAELRRAVLTETPVPAHDLNASIPHSLEQVINRVLDKNRERRYQSAPELRADLIQVRQAVKSLRPSAGAVQTHIQQLFPSGKQEARVLEAAAPKESSVGCSIEVIAMVRDCSSTGGLRALLKTDVAPSLTEEDVRDRPFKIEFPLGADAKPQPLDITLRLDSPGFDPPVQAKKLKVPPTGDSPACTFLVIPRVVGRHLINVELLSAHEEVLASRSIRTQAFPSGSETSPVKLVVTIPLVLSVRTIGDRVLEMALTSVPTNANSQGIPCGPFPAERCFTSVPTNANSQGNEFLMFDPPPTGQTGGPESPGRIPEEQQQVVTEYLETAESQLSPRATVKDSGIALHKDLPSEHISHYRLLGVLGEGGMGAVYKAVNLSNGQTVAIKVIKGDFAENPELLKRFYREAQAVGNLQHPNIVSIYDLGEENGNPYMVMQYLDGTPLDKVIAQRQNLEVIHKLDIIIDVLKALDYAHEHGVIHRDVKPANVHLLKDGSVKLLAFGIEREGNLDQTKTGQVMGTIYYMPPEQMNGEVVDRRGDIFSTGIMLFELLTYSLPFEAHDQTSIIAQLLRGDPPPPLSKYFDNYPLEIDDIIARAMMRDRDKRYSRAEEFAFDLTRVQERLKRDKASHYVDQARALIAKSDLLKARDLLSEVIRIAPDDTYAKNLLSQVLALAPDDTYAKAMQAPFARMLVEQQKQTQERLKRENSGAAMSRLAKIRRLFSWLKPR